MVETLFDTSLIIRSAGERTTELVRLINSWNIADDKVKIINERPFESALRASYQVALETNSKWTVMLDADTLLFKESIEILRNKIAKSSEKTIMIQGLIFDRILGVFKPAGHRIYRTQLLSQAIPLIPEPGEYLRPEFETLIRMNKKGFKSIYLKEFFGLHDYEQFYKDLYRTAFVHAKKHQGRIEEILKNCQSNLSTTESKVVVKGLMDGLLYSNGIKLDAQWFDELSKQTLSKLEIQEKEPLQNSSIKDSFNWIENERVKILLNHKVVGDNKIDRLLYNIKQKGFVKGNIYSLAKLLENISK